MTATLAFDQLRIDDVVTDWISQGRSQPWIGLAHAVTFLGNGLTTTVICVVVVIGLLLRRHLAEAVLLGVGASMGWVAMVGIKHLVARGRPPITDRLIDIGTYSFPSGHAMTSMIVYCLLAVVAYRLCPWVRAHRSVLILAPLLSIAIGISRVYLGVHWTTDVLAGWLFGALWVALCLWIMRRITLRH